MNKEITVFSGEGLIQKEHISSLLLKACPSFKAAYDASDDKDLDYIIAGAFAHHLLTLYQKNEKSEFPEIAKLIGADAGQIVSCPAFPRVKNYVAGISARKLIVSCPAFFLRFFP